MSKFNIAGPELKSVQYSFTQISSINRLVVNTCLEAKLTIFDDNEEQQVFVIELNSGISDCDNTVNNEQFGFSGTLIDRIDAVSGDLLELSLTDAVMELIKDCKEDCNITLTTNNLAEIYSEILQMVGTACLEDYGISSNPYDYIYKNIDGDEERYYTFDDVDGFFIDEVVHIESIDHLILQGDNSLYTTEDIYFEHATNLNDESNPFCEFTVVVSSSRFSLHVQTSRLKYRVALDCLYSLYDNLGNDITDKIGNDATDDTFISDLAVKQLISKAEKWLIEACKEKYTDVSNEEVGNSTAYRIKERKNSQGCYIIFSDNDDYLNVCATPHAVPYDVKELNLHEVELSQFIATGGLDALFA